jgi:hypothetical protein
MSDTLSESRTMSKETRTASKTVEEIRSPSKSLCIASRTALANATPEVLEQCKSQFEALRRAEVLARYDHRYDNRRR